jgi:Domain of unknown function (DUF4124)
MNKKIGAVLFVAAAAFASTAFVSTAFVSTAVAQTKLYKWTDASGKVHYTDKLPTESAGRASEELSKGGTVVRKNAAPISAEERAELEQERKRKLEEAALAKEQRRKDLALLNTYSSERDIEEARARALKANEDAIKDAERKLAEARKRGDKLRGEAEFYAKKPMPRQLQQDISVNELEIKAQTEVADAKRRDVASINAKYDDDKRRFEDLNRASKTAAAPVATATR